MDKYLIAHDLGTSGDKASLFSIEGKLVKSYTASYKTHYFHNNYAEQETEDWWEAICRSTKEIVKDIEPEAVLGISFSSQMQACVMVDEKGNALRPVMIWADQRSGEQMEKLTEKVGADRMYEINGHRPSASYSIEKLMWFRDHEPSGRTVTGGSERPCIPSISCGGEKSEMESGCIGKLSRNPDGA